MTDISQLRKEYKKANLEIESTEKNPIEKIKRWVEDAVKNDIQDPNAMVLSTINLKGGVSSRVVLAKKIRRNGIVFYTNYNSTKSKEIKSNSKVSLLFYWPELERQVRVEGFAKEISKKDSDTYFRSRPYESQIGAWSSPQSQEIISRIWLEKKVIENKKKYKDSPPRPEFWGGFLVIPVKFEFWQGRPSRLHDRLCYEQITENGKANWVVKRLAP